ncbi:unnamed protein product [Pieris macdunnoughi]|uniref:Apyrase n=2 Tax=Pieris macdunnoughi TaxID=345717 RepID=A0A821PFK0_9NEOP|nr:unnamed protein product [Pieris macdunnoughi]
MMRKIIIFLCFAWFDSGCNYMLNCKVYPLHLIHYNDFHARFEETSDDSLLCDHNKEKCYGGLPRLLYKIEAIRRLHPDSVLLDAGDSFQGTYWYTLLKWNATQYFLNLLNNDAHAIGNHEFDDDIDGLAPYLANLKAPALAANLDASEEPRLKGLFKSYTIIERKGKKIGIVGVTTTATKGLAPTGNVKFTDPREAALRESKNLRDMGVDVIILLSHCGYTLDVEIAQDYGQYIDLVVGGHSHRDKTVMFPYLTVVKSKSDNNHQVLVLQTDAFTKFLGNITINFNCIGDILNWYGEPIALDNSIPEDENLKNKLASYAEQVHTAAAKVIGHIDKTMDHRDCVHGECLMGNFLADMMRYTAQLKIKTPYPIIALIQRSNMRAIIRKGELTEGSIVELFPYLDLLTSFELQGKYLYEALERSASDLIKGERFTGPWLLQVSGLQVTYNISRPMGNRVASAYVKKKFSTVPLDKDKIYQIVAPIYLTDGGDGYTMISDNHKNPEILGYDQHRLREYIKAYKSINVKIEGRILIS